MSVYKWLVPVVASGVVGVIAYEMGMPASALLSAPGVVLLAYSIGLFGAGVWLG